jgi:VIT1/CCC1 family predicted Fe2+/Mn2+ transporter
MSLKIDVIKSFFLGLKDYFIKNKVLAIIATIILSLTLTFTIGYIKGCISSLSNEKKVEDEK